MSKKTKAYESGEQEPEDDNLLIRRAAAGDIEAYGKLVERYQQRIFNLIGRLVGRREAVEDLAQEVFIKAFRKIGSFRFEASFYTWLYSIALNTCRNYYRRRGPATVPLEGHEGKEEAGATADERDAPDEVVSRRQRAELVRKALEQLPEEQKEALILCDLEGSSYQEIADITGVPIGTVRSRIFRARANLKGLLPEEMGKG